MGEMADDMIEGSSCSLCGIFFEEEHGYPVICNSCFNHLNKADKDKTIKSGIQRAINKEM